MRLNERSNSNYVQLILDIQRQITALGVVVNDRMTASDHVTELLSSCTQLLYALRVLRGPRVFCGLADLRTNQWVFCGPSCGRRSAKYPPQNRKSAKYPLQSSKRRPTQSTVVIYLSIYLSNIL